MAIVLRVNHGNESIALISTIFEMVQNKAIMDKVYCVYIETGWEGQHWLARVKAGQAYASSCGFETHYIVAKPTFTELIQDREAFPTTKFQWCAGFLKGIPFLNWLDKHDSQAKWQIVLPKRQEIYRFPIPEKIAECPHHGDRSVWHPMLHFTTDERDALIQNAGFDILQGKSDECAPCVNSTLFDIQRCDDKDIQKCMALENQIGKPMFSGRFKGADSLATLKSSQQEFKQSKNMDAFTMGCGDPFGCGL
jgi:hypothetical protein